MLKRFCVLMLTPIVALQAENLTPIDRHALVTRHNITWNDPARHLPLGNGEFSFGADGTGLQTFGGNSMSHWGWHSFPLPDGWTPDRVPSTGTFQKGRNTGPDNNSPPGTEAIQSWMRDNPHIMNLGRLRLMRSGGRVLTPGEVTGLKRSLDLWSGVQTSHYLIDGNEVNVETCVHPRLDMVAVRIESPLVERGELEVALDFGYPSMNNGAWVGDFNRTTGHSTVGTRQGDRRADLVRKVDAVTYYAALMAGEGGTVRLPAAKGAPQHTHEVWTVSARGSKVLSLVCAYSADPLPRVLPSCVETRNASAVRWETFWKSGGAIDLSGSSDARWKELERRIVLSQYLMAAMSAGSWPFIANYENRQFPPTVAELRPKQLTRVEDHFDELIEAMAPQTALGLIENPARPLEITRLKPKSISLHWEFMFTRSRFQTPDMAEQGRLLSEVAGMVDVGRIQTTMQANLGPINATNMRRAHSLIESGKTVGKIVLAGF